MIRQLASGVCLAFIAVLLVRDVRRRTSLSWALWLPTIMLLVLASRPVTTWLGIQGEVVNEENYLEGSPIDRLFYLFLIVTSGVVATLRGVKWRTLLAANLAITALYIYFGMSVFWAADPLGSSKRLFKDFGLIVVGAVILSEKDPIQAIRAVYVRCACILIPLSVLFIKYYPELGRFYTRSGVPTYTGVAMQKNSLGELVLVFSGFLIWDAAETKAASGRSGWRRWDYAVLLLLGVWLLNISESKTALLCIVIGLVLVMRGSRFGSPVTNRAILAGALALPFVVFFVQSSTLMAPLVEALGRDMTFTGRTDIWQTTLAQDLDPIFGAGFWNFWGRKDGPAATIIAAIGTENMPSAHNGYLDIYLDGGLIAVGLLFCLLFLNGMRLSRGLQTSSYQRVRFAVLIIAIVYNLSESTFFRLSPIWFSTLLMFVGNVTLRSSVADAVSLSVEQKVPPVSFSAAYQARKRC